MTRKDTGIQRDRSQLVWPSATGPTLFNIMYERRYVLNTEPILANKVTALSASCRKCHSFEKRKLGFCVGEGGFQIFPTQLSEFKDALTKGQY